MFFASSGSSGRGPRPTTNWSDDNGVQDVFYASSSDGGQSYGPNIVGTDRCIDRSIGVWSNNVGSAAPVGMDSTDDAVYVYGRTPGTATS